MYITIRKHVFIKRFKLCLPRLLECYFHFNYLKLNFKRLNTFYLN